MIEYKEKALVSACLLGVKCRYDGGHTLTDLVQELNETVDLIPVCPEQLGGLTTPRPAAQIDAGDGKDVLEGTAKVKTVEAGRDVTDNYRRGAEAALAIARFYGASKAYLKTRSPSCGCGEISRDGKRLPGDGVTTALLKREGLEVIPVEGQKHPSLGEGDE